MISINMSAEEDEQSHLRPRISSGYLMNIAGKFVSLAYLKGDGLIHSRHLSFVERRIS